MISFYRKEECFRYTFHASKVYIPDSSDNLDSLIVVTSGQLVLAAIYSPTVDLALSYLIYATKILDSFSVDQDEDSYVYNDSPGTLRENEVGGGYYKEHITLVGVFEEPYDLSSLEIFSAPVSALKIDLSFNEVLTIINDAN